MSGDIKLTIKGVDVLYRTRPGIFAQHGIDDGTKLLLESVDIEDNILIADLGGGAGVVSLVAAQLNRHGHVHLLDDHLRAVETAKANVELNNLKNVEVFLSDLFSAVPGRTYQLVLCNPPQQLGNEFLLELIEETKKHLKPQGQFFLVVKNNVKPVIERFLKQVFNNFKIIKSGKEHSILRAVNG